MQFRHRQDNTADDALIERNMLGLFLFCLFQDSKDGGFQVKGFNIIKPGYKNTKLRIYSCKFKQSKTMKMLIQNYKRNNSKS
jgi:hypothetical protein